jgi:hypothetical protein
MSELTKGLIQRQDMDNYDGTLTTTRTSSTGGTLSGLKVGDAVDVLSVFGSGDTSNRTLATIKTAIDALGSSDIALNFAPGTWTIDDDLTIAANFTAVVPAGCVFNVSAGKTLTIAGILFRQHGTYSSGSGTVTISGTDVLATVSQAQDYAVDSGVADAYVIAPGSLPSSYSPGQVFRFKAANTNTGASTINVNSIGLKDIRKLDGSTVLAPGEIVAGQIHTIVYEGVNGLFHLMDGVEVVDLVASITAASSATIDFTANDWPSLFDGTYAKVVFELATVTPATDDTYLIMRAGIGATPTWQSGSSAYSWGGRLQGPSSGTDLGSSADSFNTGIALTATGSTRGLGTAANEHATITLEGARLGQAERIYWHWAGTYINSAATIQTITGGGQHASSTAITGVRFLMSSGNIASGTFTAYGIV